MASFRLRPLGFTLVFNGGTKFVFSFLSLRHVQATLAFEHGVPSIALKDFDGSPEAPQGQHLITRTVAVVAVRKPFFLAHSIERRGQRDIRKGIVHDIEILSKKKRSLKARLERSIRWIAGALLLAEPFVWTCCCIPCHEVFVILKPSATLDKMSPAAKLIYRLA